MFGGMTITTREAARRLGISKQRIRQLAADNRLRFEPTPLGRLFDPASIEEYRAYRDGRLRAHGIPTTAE